MTAELAEAKALAARYLTERDVTARSFTAASRERDAALAREKAMREALAQIDSAFENTDYSDSESEGHFERIRDIARAALAAGGENGT